MRGRGESRGEGGGGRGEIRGEGEGARRRPRPPPAPLDSPLIYPPLAIITSVDFITANTASPTLSLSRSADDLVITDTIS